MKRLVNSLQAYVDYTVYVDVVVKDYSSLAASTVIHPSNLRGKKYSEEDLIQYNDSIDTILCGISDEFVILPESHQSNSSYSYYCICSLKDSPNSGKFKIIFRISDYLKPDRIAEKRSSAMYTVVRNIKINGGNMAEDLKAQNAVNQYCKEFIEYVKDFNQGTIN